MADQNSKCGRLVVSLDLPAPQVVLLRRTLVSCLVGIKGDMAMADTVPKADRGCREAHAFRRLLRGLRRGEIAVPDDPAREVVATLATESDRENNYAEVVAEHDALHGLLGVLEEEGRR